VDTGLAAPRGVGDRVTRGVELVRAVLLRVGPCAGGGEAASQGHPGQRAKRFGRVRAGRPRPAMRDVLARHDALTVVRERHDEVMEDVLELGEDDAGLDRADADPAPVRLGFEVEIGITRTHDRLPVSFPLAAPGYA